MERPIDNSLETRNKRKLAWQFVLPNIVILDVIELPPGQEAVVIDLNANVINIRPPDEAA